MGPSGLIEEMPGESTCGLGAGAGEATFEGEAALERRRAGQQSAGGQPGGWGRANHSWSPFLIATWAVPASVSATTIRHMRHIPLLSISVR